MINFEDCYWDDLVNEAFVPLIENRDRYLILYGGRSSSKSDFTAKKLIFRCLTEKYFKYVLVRTNYNTIKESQYDTIKSIIEEWGIESYFEFKLSPLEIICKNGNRFICRGCDDPKKLKSIRNPTGVWWEEDVPSYEDFVTITLTVRSNEADYLQEIFTINPEVDGDYNEHWFYKRFFGNRTETSFRDTNEIEIGGKLLKMSWTVMHSTYKDNKWSRTDNIVQLESYKTEDPHKYLIHTLGLWGNPARDGLFYKKFNRINNVDKIKYNPNIALHISFDFNVRPYLSIVITQLVDKTIYLIDEIAAKDPDNNTRDACRLFVNNYRSHSSGLFVYGDPSGRSDSTRSEVGYNDYRIIEQELKDFRPTFRIATKHPPVKKRGEFINDIFAKEWNGLKLIVGENCHLTINDFINVKEKPDGTKLKEKQDGYEKWAHMSDAIDYLICEAFKNEFRKYQNGDLNIEPIWMEHIPSPKFRL